jgi:hypothetical protein
LPKFIENGTQKNITFDAQEFDVFRFFFVKSNTLISFEINTINRSFIVDIVLLDGNNQPLYNFSFDVPAFQELKS